MTAVPLAAVGYEFNWSILSQVWPHLVAALWVTLELTGIVAVAAAILAFPVAVARMSSLEILRWPAQLYIEVFRCTPLLVQLIWVFYALPIVTGINLTAFQAGAVGLTANYAAFLAEVYRAGFQGVPQEHIESGRVLGLSRWRRYRSIVLPQGLLAELPVILSLLVTLFKDTSLVSVIGVQELTYVANLQATQTFRPIEIYSALAVMYFAIAFPVTLIVSRLEVALLRRYSANRPSEVKSSMLTDLPASLIAMRERLRGS